jgi:hypothetical protein
MPLAKVVLVDFGGTGVDPAELEPVAEALQIQVNTQFAVPAPDGWGIGVEYVRSAGAADIKADEIVLGLWEKADMPGALGYHEKSPHGLPYAKCFPLLDKGDNHAWPITASHELLELLCDGELGMCSQNPNTGAIWALEVCDAVERDSYLIEGIAMSNWNTPAWFCPPTQGGKFDFLGLCSRPYEIRPGGYGQTWDGQSWNMTYASSPQLSPRSYRLSVIGRGLRRQMRLKGAAS